MSRIFMPGGWISGTRKSNKISRDGVFADHGRTAVDSWFALSVRIGVPVPTAVFIIFHCLELSLDFGFSLGAVFVKHVEGV